MFVNTELTQLNIYITQGKAKPYMKNQARYSSTRFLDLNQSCEGHPLFLSRHKEKKKKHKDMGIISLQNS